MIPGQGTKIPHAPGQLSPQVTTESVHVPPLLRLCTLEPWNTAVEAPVYHTWKNPCTAVKTPNAAATVDTAVALFLAPSPISRGSIWRSVCLVAPRTETRTDVASSGDEIHAA